MKKAKDIFLVLIAFSVSLLTIYFFVKYIMLFLIFSFNKIINIASKADAVVIVASITGGVSILGVVIAKIIEYKQNTKRFLYQKRETAYADFIELIYKIHTKAKKNEEYGDLEMQDDVATFSKKLTLWGSDAVISKWLEFRRNSVKNITPAENLFLIEDIIMAIRRDMGQSNNLLKKGDILSFFVNDVDEYLKKKKQV